MSDHYEDLTSSLGSEFNRFLLGDSVPTTLTDEDVREFLEGSDAVRDLRERIAHTPDDVRRVELENHLVRDAMARVAAAAKRVGTKAVRDFIRADVNQVTLFEVEGQGFNRGALYQIDDDLSVPLKHLTLHRALRNEEPNIKKELAAARIDWSHIESLLNWLDQGLIEDGPIAEVGLEAYQRLRSMGA